MLIFDNQIDILQYSVQEWSRPSQDNRIIIRNLPPGSYTLQIRAVSNEEKYKTYETRSIQIIITPPVWASVCLLYTSPSPRDRQKSRMPSSA